MPITEQNAVIEKVAHQQTLDPRDRLAAILAIVFAQRMEDVAALTWDRVTITAEAATITLADTPIKLPPPLDEPLRALAASNYNKQTAAHPKSPWIFRGYRPGLHLAPTHLRNPPAPRARHTGRTESNPRAQLNINGSNNEGPTTRPQRLAR